MSHPTEPPPYVPGPPPPPVTPPSPVSPPSHPPSAAQFYPVVVQAPPTSGLAVGSLIFAILGLLTFCCSFGVANVIAVALGHLALRDIKAGIRGGHGTAMAGLILGYLGAIPVIIGSISLGIGGIGGLFVPDAAPTPTP